ncbi:MAG: hypothetical protein J3K34DRAFT_423274 [Monoraphidium minutum]|nr:MAG: hypothetical protein J3K34DRAFT_423274 [Monoraphidium minutum]
MTEVIVWPALSFSQLAAAHGCTPAAPCSWRGNTGRASSRVKGSGNARGAGVRGRGRSARWGRAVPRPLRDAPRSMQQMSGCRSVQAAAGGELRSELACQGWVERVEGVVRSRGGRGC